MSPTFFRRSKSENETNASARKPRNKVAQDGKSVVYTRESFRQQAVGVYKRAYVYTHVQNVALSILGMIGAYAAGYLTGYMLVTIIFWLATHAWFVAAIASLCLIVHLTMKAGAKLESEVNILNLLGDKLFPAGGMKTATSGMGAA